MQAVGRSRKKLERKKKISYLFKNNKADEHGNAFEKLVPGA